MINCEILKPVFVDDGSGGTKKVKSGEYKFTKEQADKLSKSNHVKVIQEKPKNEKASAS